MSYTYVRDTDAPLRPPPVGTSGPVGWLRENLFPNVWSSLLTLLLGLLLGYLVWSVLDWAVLRAAWTGTARTGCAFEGAGA